MLLNSLFLIRPISSNREIFKSSKKEKRKFEFGGIKGYSFYESFNLIAYCTVSAYIIIAKKKPPED